jgi:hypothetical protein
MLFTKDDVGNMTEEEFDEAISGLIDKGLLTVSYEDGEPIYELTQLGEVVHEHILSDPKERN